MTATNVGGLGELWKDVPGYEGYYQASTLGRVRSVDRYCGISRQIYRSGMILKPFRHYKGYQLVALMYGGAKKTKTVHSLIALTFLGPRPPKYDINHINGIKNDNRLQNLEYITARENQIHAFALKLRKPLTKHNTFK